MKALGLVGSYRRNGLVHTAIAEVLRGAADEGARTELVFLMDEDIGFCRNCRTCCQLPGDEPGTCMLSDAMRGLIDKCRRAEVLALGGPVVMGLPTAVLKKFGERLLPLLYWPWGGGMPQPRRGMAAREGVLVTTAFAPEWVLPIAQFPARKFLRDLAKSFNARVVADLAFGGAAHEQESALSAGQLAKCRAAGAAAARAARKRGAGERNGG